MKNKGNFLEIVEKLPFGAKIKIAQKTGLTTKTAYNANTLEKVPFGNEKAETDTFCSFAFSGYEVMRADGEMHMYERINDPELRGTIVGFDKRFIALPIRNKAIGAIVSAKV